MGKIRKQKDWKKTQGIIAVLIVFSIGIFGFWQSRIEKRNLKNYNETIGIITEKYSIRSRGYYVNYSYSVDNNRYNGSQSITDNKINESIKTGDRFLVHYSILKPEHSELIFEKKVENQNTKE